MGVKQGKMRLWRGLRFSASRVSNLMKIRNGEAEKSNKQSAQFLNQVHV